MKASLFLFILLTGHLNPIFGQNDTVHKNISITEDRIVLHNMPKQYDKCLQKYTKRTLEQHFQLLLDSAYINGEKYGFSVDESLRRRGLERLYYVRTDLPLIYVDNALLDPFDSSLTYSRNYASKIIIDCVYIKPKKNLDPILGSDSNLNLVNGLILFFTDMRYKDGSFYLHAYKKKKPFLRRLLFWK